MECKLRKPDCWCQVAKSKTRLENLFKILARIMVLISIESISQGLRIMAKCSLTSGVKFSPTYRQRGSTSGWLSNQTHQTVKAMHSFTKQHKEFTVHTPLSEECWRDFPWSEKQILGISLTTSFLNDLQQSSWRRVNKESRLEVKKVWIKIYVRDWQKYYNIDNTLELRKKISMWSGLSTAWDPNNNSGW